MRLHGVIILNPLIRFAVMLCCLLFVASIVGTFGAWYLTDLVNHFIIIFRSGL